MKLGFPNNSTVDFSDELFPHFTVMEVRALVNQIKSRAPGYDYLTGPLLSKGWNRLLEYLTIALNKMIDDQEIPQSINIGILNLLPKAGKGSALELKDRRPINILGIFTKRTAQRMMHIAEREQQLHETAFGFRQNRSTVQCLFILNTIISKAKKQKKPITIGCIDLDKAYDRVPWEKMYALLEKLGYTGKSLNLIQSLYRNESVKVCISGILTNKIFLNKGVKQGCALSPLLFALFVSSLGKILQDAEDRVRIGNQTMSTLFFADDIIIISKSEKRGVRAN